MIMTLVGVVLIGVMGIVLMDTQKGRLKND